MERHLGLIAAMLLIIGLWLVVYRWPQGRHMTFSQHVAQHKSATIYYIALFALTLPLLNLFFIAWFTPQFELPAVWFNGSVLAASILQIGCTLIPEIGGWRTKWHQLLAGMSALLLLAPLGIIATAPRIATEGRVLAGVSLIVMLGIIGFATHVKGKHPSLLTAQALYFVAFFVPILAISYI